MHRRGINKMRGEKTTTTTEDRQKSKIQKKKQTHKSSERCRRENIESGSKEWVK